MRIANTNTDESIYVIAEIGGNHNGDPDITYKLVEEAAKAGACAVKFQTYSAETLIHPSVEPLPIVKKFYKTQLERFKGLELDWSVYERIMEMCKTLGIDFLTTPFDLDILKTFAPLMPAIKISSGDITYEQMIKRAAASGKPVIVSTGMSEVSEIARVVDLVPNDRLSLLHCVSIYPSPDEKANLGAIAAMARRWPTVTIGYSDHTLGIDACIAAVTLGARIIEKHFTLDKTQVPGDHLLSADTKDLVELVQKSKRVLTLLGEGDKKPADGEEVMRRQMRRGLYAARDLNVGHEVTADDIIIIRPETALAPSDCGLLVGRNLKVAMRRHDAFSRESVA